MTATTAAASTVSLRTMDELTTAKTLAMLLLGTGSFVLGIAPTCLVKRRRAEHADIEAATCKSGNSHHPGDAALSSPFVPPLLCFGGGVLLFTALFHMWPEVRQTVGALQKGGVLPAGFGYLADLIVLAGIPLCYLLDKVVNCVLDKCAADPCDETEALLLGSVGPQKCAVTDSSSAYAPSGCDADSQPRPADGGWSFRILFTVIGLSLHEVFEGLAIGLEKRVENVWYLLVAVATHELVIAVCVGLDLAWSRTRVSAIVMCVAVLALITPVGVAVGMWLMNRGGCPGAVAVVLQGLAVGTLLYVVIFEIVPKHYRPRFLHTLAILAGFFLMFALQLTTHKHCHGSSVDHRQQYATTSNSTS